ncbi:hypothetical protein M1437_01945, partial [Patescibacteria group bacterium]|nr:hypothetical protein [Patescibacteria group bacterium]
MPNNNCGRKFTVLKENFISAIIKVEIVNKNANNPKDIILKSIRGIDFLNTNKIIISGIKR